MGISIFCRYAASSYPVPMLLRLVCDVDGRDQDFEGGHIEAFAAAMRAGWKETQSSNGRRFLCPACSGKQARTVECQGQLEF